MVPIFEALTSPISVYSSKNSSPTKLATSPSLTITTTTTLTSTVAPNAHENQEEQIWQQHQNFDPHSTPYVPIKANINSTIKTPLLSSEQLKNSIVDENDENITVNTKVLFPSGKKATNKVNLDGGKADLNNTEIFMKENISINTSKPESQINRTRSMNTNHTTPLPGINEDAPHMVGNNLERSRNSEDRDNGSDNTTNINTEESTI